MTADQALTYCRRSCGNNMHVKCMKMYSDFQKTSCSKVSGGGFGRCWCGRVCMQHQVICCAL
jgi:hypothetical protein